MGNTVFLKMSVALVSALGLLVVWAGLASANFDPPAADCSKFKKGSKDWKECTGQVKTDVDPDVAERFTHGYWLAKTGDYVKALDVLRALPDQNDPGVLTMIGFATRHMGRVDEGIGYYAQALARNPEMTNTRQYLGEAYLQKNDVPRAKFELAEIARICGSEACADYRDLAREIEAHEAKG